jgi:hypothetical protein
VGATANWRAYILSGHTQGEIQAGLDPTYGKAAPNYTTAESTSNYAFFDSVQTGSNRINWGWARIQHKVDSSGNILYQRVFDGTNTTLASEVDTTTGKTVYHPPILLVTAEGIQGTVRRMIQVEYQPIVKTTTTSDTVVTDPFSNAAHGQSSVTLIGNVQTDSYNSNNGAYNVGGNKGSKGSIGTDATAAGSISIDANAVINGNVYYGPGGSSSTVTNNGTVTGTIQAEPATWDMPLSTIPAGLTNSGALSISGNRTVTLAEGTYWFSSLSISGNGKLVTSGKVKIYVTGSIDIGGNGYAAANNKPPNLLIYGTVDPANSANKCTSVSIHGNGEFYGAIYAPAADIRVVGNGQVFGALTGKTVLYNGNGWLHYDDALGQLDQSVTTSTSKSYELSGYTRYLWRELAF